MAVGHCLQELGHVERVSLIIKVDDLDLRPVYDDLEATRPGRRADPACLAAHPTWYLCTAWALLTFTDEDLPALGDPVAPALRSAGVRAKAPDQHAPVGEF